MRKLVVRNYVIVSTKLIKGRGNNLIFWGKRSDDYEERSFGGYTDDLGICERYSRSDIEKNRPDIPIWDRQDKSKSLTDFANLAIKLSDLFKYFDIQKKVVLIY